MSEHAKTSWDREDHALEEEFGEVVPFVASVTEQAPAPPRALDARILDMAHSRVANDLDKSWLLGQGPRLILVTCILFAIAMMVLLGVF